MVLAVKLAARLKPELVLTDIEMPEMDGLEAADASRPDAFLPKNGRMGHALAKSQGTECSSQAPSSLDSLVKDGSEGLHKRGKDR
jgi:CheY-like chemotaxis protein